VLFDVMADSVERIETGSWRRSVNNVLYGYEHLDVTFRPSG
jgi:hypothetical protein